MQVRVAVPTVPDDLRDVARLLFEHAAPEEQARQCLESFTVDLASWWQANATSHSVFLAFTDEGAAVGCAWLALLPRPPRPGSAARFSADLQSLFVEDEYRGRGIGAALIRGASEEAVSHGASRVTVNSGSRAVPLYRRLGFADSRQLLQQELG